MKSNMIFLPLVTFGASMLMCRADVIVPAFEVPSGGPGFSGNSGNPVNLGLVFTPAANLSVNDLGFYDTAGVTTGETVTIFDSTGNIVAQAAVPDTGLTTDGYFWQSITPVTLIAGNQYTLDAETGNNPWSAQSTPVVNPDITYNFHDYDYSSSVAFPQNTAGAAASAYFGPDFSIAAIPESTPLLACAVTLLPMGWGVLRRLRPKRFI